MSNRYAVQEDTPHGQLLSWNGLTIVHDSRSELEFLLTGDIRIVPCPPSIPPEQAIELRFHPQFSHHTFPLVNEAYR